MAYRINKSEIEEVKKIYLAYKKAYKKQLSKDANEVVESTKRHLKGKFKHEDTLIEKFIANPTSTQWYRVTNGIFGPNEGNRYPSIKKILERFDKISDKVYNR